MLKNCLYIFLFVLVFAGKAQINAETKRANHWYFGQGAGIDWTSGVPVVVSNGQTNSYEGAASISDLNGNLLFYSDGNTIWNKNHIPMQNGYDLLGCNGIPTPINVTQNALIIPHPGNDSLYYLFHLGCLDFQTYTLKYTVVNIKLNSGLGKVISANNAIMPTKTQALAACRHADGCSVWIVAIDTNQNYSFLKFTSTGLNTSPINTPMNLNFNLPVGWNCSIKFSPKLNYFAAMPYSGFASDSLMIHKFNNSNAQIISTVKVPTGDQEIYDICFSPDETKLYGGGENPGGTYINNIWQFNLSLFNQASIISSKTVIYTDSCFFGQMQNGLDNKIYISRGSYSFVNGNTDSLAIINTPNASGLACNFNFNAVYLNGKPCIYSLPSFDQAYFYPLLNNTCVTGVNEITATHFKIYPNPTTDFVNIENTVGFDFELQFFDVNGKIIETNSIHAFKTKKINISQLNNGIYILQLKNNNNVLNYKFIKN